MRLQTCIPIMYTKVIVNVTSPQNLPSASMSATKFGEKCAAETNDY